MDDSTAAFLTDLNRRFYSDFGPAFAATRRRLQPGVYRALALLPDEGAWLDLGCGSGSLAAEWLRRGRRSAYLGVDFSEALLQEARTASAARPDAQSAAGSVRFALADLSAEDWAGEIRGPFRGALCFAVLHHLPGRAARARLLRQARGLLEPGGLFVHSVWQFQHSEKLMARRQPWSAVGLDEASLEPGDTLLDWRYALPGQAEQVGLRYVHLFSRGELDGLAQETGFHVLETYESDGQGGRLGLYQFWQAA